LALSGVFITFSDTARGLVQGHALLPYRATGSQLMPSPGTSTVEALAHGIAQQLLSISASAPIEYTVGPDPDLTSGVIRYYDPSLGREDVFCDPGDKFAWEFA
jgi:hypothetical protein